MVFINSTVFLQFGALTFDIFHIALMLFIAFGWLAPHLRKIHLIVVLITGSSWLIFSNGNGIVNCILTDWHYEVLRKLGETNLPETYAQYVFQRLTGLTIQKYTAMSVTRSGWLFSLILSSVMAYRGHGQARKVKCINSHYPQD
jgi:hypothetical protein